MAEQKDTDILKDAASLWKAITSSAQMHKICYDKELLSGNESVSGLYANLGIADPVGPDFLDDLERYNVSIEQLLVAFFRTLQPYAQMMSKLCAFFQRHAIKETNNYLRIKFDFEDVGLEDLEFDLEHFREQLNKFKNAQETVSYFFLNQNAIWGMLQVLSKDYTEISEAPWIKRWEQDFNIGMWSAVDLPLTGHSVLDANLSKVYDVYRNFTDAANALGIVEVKQYEKPNTRNFRDAMIDYLQGVENAHVFLVNYGKLRPAMEVPNPKRCTALGQVYPNTPAAEIFQEELGSKLPMLPLSRLDNISIGLSDQDWLTLRKGYDCIYVDISQSLNLENYKNFLKTVLKWSIDGNAIGQITAIDEEIRCEWVEPTESHIDFLLSLPFNNGTDFSNKIHGEHILFITDADGQQQLLSHNRVKSLHILCYAENEAITFKRIINSPVRIRKFIKKNVQ